jgi:hypothetical protein
MALLNDRSWFNRPRAMSPSIRRRCCHTPLIDCLDERILLSLGTPTGLDSRPDGSMVPAQVTTLNDHSGPLLTQLALGSETHAVHHVHEEIRLEFRT